MFLFDNQFRTVSQPRSVMHRLMLVGVVRRYHYCVGQSVSVVMCINAHCLQSTHVRIMRLFDAVINNVEAQEMHSA